MVKIIEIMKRIFHMCMIFSVFSCGDYDPYEEGAHWDYSISCEGGFKYKHLEQRRVTILLLNSDGTPLCCDKKRY